MILHELQGLNALGVACLTFFVPLAIVLGFLLKEKNHKGSDEDHH